MRLTHAAPKGRSARRRANAVVTPLLLAALAAGGLVMATATPAAAAATWGAQTSGTSNTLEAVAFADAMLFVNPLDYSVVSTADSTSPSFSAALTTERRLRTPSLVSTADTWCSTVLLETMR